MDIFKLTEMVILTEKVIIGKLNLIKKSTKFTVVQNQSQMNPPLLQNVIVSSNRPFFRILPPQNWVPSLIWFWRARPWYFLIIFPPFRAQ